MRSKRTATIVLALAVLLTAAVPTPVAAVAAMWTNMTSANGLAFDRVMSVFAEGSTIYAGTLYGLSISTDGGQSWRTSNTSNGLIADPVYDVYASGSDVYVAASSVAGGLSISHDGGYTWRNTTPANGYLFSAFIRELQVVGGDVYVATSFGLQVSNDGGASFNYPMLDGQNLFGLVVDGSSIYAASSDGLWISTDSGSTWVLRTRANGLDTNLLRTVAVSNGIIYAAGNNGLFVSSDGGETFLQLPLGNYSQPIVMRVRVVANDIYLATMWGVWISTNGGASFTKFDQADGLGSYVIDDVFVTSDRLYAATEGGLSFTDFPTVVSIRTIPEADNGPLTQGQLITVKRITTFIVQITQELYNPPGASEVHDATNPSNYILLMPGKDDLFETSACAGAPAGDDALVPTDFVDFWYGNGFTYALLTVNGDHFLQHQGAYRLLVCGADGLDNVAGLPLRGGSDFSIDFVIRHAQ